MADMNSRFTSDPVWIDHPAALEKMLYQFDGLKQLGIDTESNSLFAYQEQVCLIQISTGGEDYLLDAMTGMDLSALGRVFANPAIEKIFHAAEYDILCLKRDFGFQFNNIFDTMQAARILGYEKLGLAGFLKDLCGIDHGKSFQKADWGKRPLPIPMREYARMDTHFLSLIRDFLAQNLADKNLTELAREDFQRLCTVEANHKNAPLYAQVGGYQTLDPQQLRVLEELCQYRDEQARKFKRPLFKVIGDAALLAIAQTCPLTLDDLKAIVELSPKLFSRHAAGLLSAIKNGLSLPPIHVQLRRRPSQAYIDRLEALKDWRKVAARQMGVQSDIILPRDILEKIAGSNPKTRDELRNQMSEIPWRYAHFGEEIMEVVKSGKPS
jgi:ribonuclease D